MSHREYTLDKKMNKMRAARGEYQHQKMKLRMTIVDEVMRTILFMGCTSAAVFIPRDNLSNNPKSDDDFVLLGWEVEIWLPSAVLFRRLNKDCQSRRSGDCPGYKPQATTKRQPERARRLTKSHD